jgi:hypothetical protein
VKTDGSQQAGDITGFRSGWNPEETARMPFAERAASLSIAEVKLIGHARDQNETLHLLAGRLRWV